MSNTKSPDAEMTIQGDEQTPSASAQLKRRLQEILQCVVCLQVSPDKIIQCQNGHLLCKRCSKNDNIKQCPTCRGPLLDKKVRNLAVEQFIEFMGMTFECQHPNCEFSAPKMKWSCMIKSAPIAWWPALMALGAAGTPWCPFAVCWAIWRDPTECHHG